MLILLELCTVPWLGDNRLSITIGEHTYEPTPMTAGINQFVYLETRDIDGAVTIEFEVQGAIVSGPDARKNLGVGAVALSYAMKDDPLSRLAVLENLAMSAANVARPALL